MKRSVIFLLFVVLTTTIVGCEKRRGTTVTAFGEGTGRTVPEFVRYYADAGTAFKKHLAARGFTAVTKPADVEESGISFVAHEDSWYEIASPNPRGILVHVRQPTENAAGLYVYVVWRAEGTATYVDDVEEKARTVRVELTEWWQEYKRKNPLPFNGK